MKIMKALALLTLLAAMVLFAPPAAPVRAATVSQTLTISDAQINATYKVRNIFNWTISDTKLAFGTDQLTVTSTLTRKGGQPISSISIWVPKIIFGRVYWKQTSMTDSAGKPLPHLAAGILTYAHSLALRGTVRVLIAQPLQGKFYRVKTVTLTPGVMTVTATVFTTGKAATTGATAMGAATPVAK